MTTSEPSTSERIAALQELAIASSLEGVRAVVARYPFLHSDDMDRQLTRAIQAGLQRNAIAKVSVLFVVRDFLARLRQSGLKPAWAAMGGVSLCQANPVAQLIQNPHPSPHQVVLCRRALELVRRDSEPELWAYLYFLLADRLVLASQDEAHVTGHRQGVYLLQIDGLTPGSTPANIQEAVRAYELAGEAWEACGKPEQAVQARYELARLLIDFPTADQRADALQRAAQLLDSTLSVWTREAHPPEWGNVQAALGLALENTPGGLDGQTLERAIGHYEAALQMPVDPSLNPCFERARRQYHLAILYTRRYRGDRVQNVERAVELLQDALAVRTREDYPKEWADTKNSLANALQQRLRDDPAGNLERAIEAYQAALDIWTRDRNPIRWAMIQRNLAEVYRHRVLGRAGENQEMAIGHFREALSVYTRRQHPAQWASIHNSLANLYCNRLMGDRAANIEQGIAYYEQAREVYTREGHPRQWAQTLNNLANAYCEREKGNHIENLHYALALYHQALEVRTRKDYPREWAATHNNVGTACTELQQWERGVEHFEDALEVRTVDTLPDKALQSARNLGGLYFGRRKWDKAIEAYRIAQAAGDALYRQAITEAGKRAEIGRRGDVAHHLAYALAQEGDLEGAVLELERGRARLLAEALARDRAILRRVDTKDRTEYERAVDRIRALQSELRAAELDAQGASDVPITARSYVEIAEELSSANEELNRVAKAIRQVPDYKGLLAQPDFDHIAHAVQVDMPLIYLVATVAGGLALVVHQKAVESVQLQDLTEKALLERVREWFRAYSVHLEACENYVQAARGQSVPEISRRGDLEPLRSAVTSTRQAWFAVLEKTTGWLWDALMGPLVTMLQSLNYDRVSLISTGLLALLPLHAAWSPGGKNAPRRYALDDVAFAYTPSAQALIHARQVADRVPGETLLAVSNPDGSLRYAGQEVSAVARHYTEPWIVEGTRATRNTVLNALPQCDVYHFACHGNNDWQSPLKSALWMFGRVRLTVDDLLGIEGRSQARLAFLSACETGLIGADLPDEVVGLAAGFLQAGTAGVISTLWPVNDRSTARLAAQFHENWREQGMAPLEALTAAQRWLRDEADDGRWAHPYYWAAFTLSGT